MASGKGIYRRGDFWLDLDRGAGGVVKGDRYYIHWYCRSSRRVRRKSSGECDVRLAIEALDRHYLAATRPTERDKAAYTVSDAIVDYVLERGSTRVSADAIKARLKLIHRFIEHEANAGRLFDPLLPEHIDDGFIESFRAWAIVEPIISYRKMDNEWVESSRRPRKPSTVEESVIQLKAALNFAKKRKRTNHIPDFEHKTRAQVTPARNDRLSVDQIADLLNYTVNPQRCDEGKYAAPQRLMPLRRYVIAALCTVGRPDAIMDMSVDPARGQWLKDVDLFDLNPAGRIQTKKYRAVIPLTSLLRDWLETTDDKFVCGLRNTGTKADPFLTQYSVGSVKSAWDSARDALGFPLGWGPKLLRHSMATILANRGVLSDERKLIMGHEVLQGSQKAYVIFEPDYLRKARQVIEDLIEQLRQKAPLALNANVLNDNVKKGNS